MSHWIIAGSGPTRNQVVKDPAYKKKHTTVLCIGRQVPPPFDWDYWLEVHNWEHVCLSPAYKRWLKAEDAYRILFTERDLKPNLPRSTFIDFTAIEEEYGTEFLTNSIAMAMAYALYQDAESLSLYGIDQRLGSVYEGQRAGPMHFKALAESKGIGITTPPNCGLNQQQQRYPYGR